MPSEAAELAPNAKEAVEKAVTLWRTDFSHFLAEPIPQQQTVQILVIFSNPSIQQPVAPVQVRVLFTVSIPALKLSYRIENESLAHHDSDKVFFHPTWLARTANFKQDVFNKFKGIFTTKHEATRLAAGSILDKLGRSARTVNIDSISGAMDIYGKNSPTTNLSNPASSNDQRSVGAPSKEEGGKDANLKLFDCLVQDSPKQPRHRSVVITLTPEATLVRDGTHRTVGRSASAREIGYTEEHAKAIASIREFEAELIRRFQGADTDGNGVLDSAEFFEILKSCGLGLENHDVVLLMSEADENSDGQVDYTEFVPIAAELLQIVTNAQFAEFAAAERESQIRDDELQELYSDELGSTIYKVERKLDAVAPSWRQDFRILRTVFRECLGDRRNRLLREEINMCMGLVPVDPTNASMVMLENLADLIVQVRLKTVRTMSQRRTASGLELYLLKHMEEFEHRKAENSSVPLTGKLTPEQLRDVMLFETPQIMVSRVQAYAIVAQAQSDPETGLVDYHRFANVASFIIHEMFDVGTLKEKHELTRRADVQPIELMGGRGRVQLEKDLADLFHGYDDDGNGTLDREEFKECIEALDMNLSPATMQSLLLAADEDGSGDVDYSEFSDFAYDILLHLVREQALQDLKENKTVARLRKFTSEGPVANDTVEEEEVMK